MDPVHQLVYAAVGVDVPSGRVELQFLHAVSAHGVDHLLLGWTNMKRYINHRGRRGSHQLTLVGMADDLVFGADAAGEWDSAALVAGVVIFAVEVHVLGPVSVCHTTTAAKLRTHKDTHLDGGQAWLATDS